MVRIRGYVSGNFEYSEVSADFLGFGQMCLFDAQFVLQSVENDALLS